MDVPLKILIIDCDEVDRTMVRGALEASGLGCVFLAAGDGAAGLAVLGGQVIDCALVEYRLPDTDGLSLLHAARSSGVTTPLIFLTGPGDEELAVELMRGGANDHLSKARLSRDLLAHSVRHVVRLHQAQAEALRARADLLAREQAARAAAEDARAAAEAREREYRFLAGSIPQIVYTTDTAGAVDYLNQRWVDYTGLAIEQGLGDGWQAVVHPEDLSGLLARRAQRRGEGRTVEAEFRIRRRDGEFRWHLGRTEPMRDSKGDIVKWFGTYTDIDDRKRSAESTRFLAEASAILAGSLDYESTLAAVAKLAVPQIADWCAIDVLEYGASSGADPEQARGSPASPGPPSPTGSTGSTSSPQASSPQAIPPQAPVVHRLAIAHADPAKVELAREVSRRYPDRPDDLHGLPSVLSHGRNMIQPAVSDERLAAFARDPEHLRLLRLLGFKSAIVVPLLARGRVLGAITFINSESERVLGVFDLPVAEDLARRAAAAVDNARLYREAREAFRSTERTTALLDTVLATAPVGMAFFDGGLRFVRINDAMAAYNDMAPEAYLGRTLAEISDGLERRVAPLLRQVLETRKPVLDVELRRPSALPAGQPDGQDTEERAFLASFYPVREQSGEMLGVGAVVADITERKRAEQRLREETRVTEALHRIGQLLAAELDVRRLLQTVIDEATALTGASFGAFIHNMTDEKGDTHQLSTLSGTSSEAFEKLLVPRNTPLFSATLCGDGVVRSNDIIQDPRYANAEPLFGMAPGQISVRSYLAAAVVSRSGNVLGGLFFAHPWVGAFSERDERLIRGIAAQAATAIDNARLYEELKEAKEQAEAARESAEAANTAKDQFLAVLSHELRTPLTPVLTTVQSLEAETDLSPDLRQSVEMIRRNVELEARLIDDLLDLTRIAKNKLELNLQTIDAHEALGNALEICGEDIRAKQLTLRAELKAVRHHVKGDSARLHQIFWNLIKNAIKFTPEGGTITIRTANDEIGIGAANTGGGGAKRKPASAPAPGLDGFDKLTAGKLTSGAASMPRLVVEIRDTGIGIEAQVLPRIFDAFEQGERNITRRFGGLGLGLAISKVLVDMQGGRLAADSAGPGQGAVFTMDLATVDPARPRKMAVDPEGPRAPRGADTPAGVVASAATGTTPLDGHRPGLRILLVDDHEDTTRAMRRLLQNWGHTVSTANTVGSALNTFRAGGAADTAKATADQSCPGCFDLLISDIGLPDGSGLELIRQLHQLYPQDPVRAIALSGFGMEEDVKKSREAGFYAHLTKPIDFQKLQAVIRQATA